MRQFDVHRFRGRSAAIRPYLLVVQSNMFDRSPGVLAIPMIHATWFDRLPDSRLNPRFKIEGNVVVLDTLDLAAFPRSAFSGPPVQSLPDCDDQVVAAVDWAMARSF